MFAIALVFSLIVSVCMLLNPLCALIHGVWPGQWNE